MKGRTCALPSRPSIQSPEMPEVRAPRVPERELRFGKRDRHEARTFTRTDAHDDVLLAVLFGRGERVLYILRLRHGLAGDFEDDVTFA